MRLLALLLFAIWCAPARADDGITKLPPLPKPEWKSITADGPVTALGIGGEKPAKWELLDDAPGAELRPAPDGRSATLAASAAGRYRVIAIQGDTVYRSVVVVGGAPTPPAPPPAPPAPADPLVAALQAAYNKETAPNKMELLAKKAALYRVAADKTAKDADIETTGALIGVLNDAGDSLKDEKIPEVRKVLRLELAAKFPKDVPLTAELRQSAADTFLRLADCLAKVK